ncbi:MAG: ABC transporter substrate-binding protein [Bacteriovorax sp.]
MNKIIIPAKRVVMMSTTYLPTLELIQREDTLIGFQGKQYIVSSSFNHDKIRDVSFKFNPEDLLNLKADLIMGYDSNLSNPAQVHIFKSLNLPVVMNKDFEETSPLGRAEWIIFIASFYDLEDKAQKIFNMISDKYAFIKNENSKLPKRPKVLVGEIQNGYWVTSGGKSDLGQMIADAGGEMLFWKPSMQTQKISLEELSLLKIPVDVWLTHNTWTSRKQLEEARRKDSRYSLITIKNIFNNNSIINKHNSNDYWETGMQRPDLLLQDLSALFHPDKYVSHKLHWYHKL